MNNLSVEELLKPRYKVVIDYPNSDFEVGQIIEFGEKGTEFTGNMDWVTKMTKHKNGGGSMRSIKFFEPYPHIFKKLQWWEERKESDMPEYVKDKTSIPKIIRKVEKHFTMLAPPNQVEWIEEISMFNSDGRCYPYWAMLPATVEEYNNQKIKV